MQPDPPISSLFEIELGAGLAEAPVAEEFELAARLGKRDAALPDLWLQ